MPKTKQKTKAQLRAQLARAIAAVLSNPVTPAVIYNGLAEATNDLFNSLPASRLDQSEQYISMLLDEHEQQTQEARTNG